MSLANLPSPASLSKVRMINRQNSHIVTGMGFDSPLPAKLLISSTSFFIAESWEHFKNMDDTSSSWKDAGQVPEIICNHLKEFHKGINKITFCARYASL